MSNEYNIDDILSEVKKRREENEKAVKGDNADTSSKVISEEVSENTVFEEPEDKKEDNPIAQKVENPQEEEPFIEKEESQDELDENEQEQDDFSNEPEQTQEESEDMVDLLSFTPQEVQESPSQDEQEEKIPFRKTKKGKIVISIIIALVALIVIAGVVGVFYINGIFNKITDEDDVYEKKTYYDGMDFLQEDFPTIDEMSASEVYNYKEYLKQWYQNGDPVSSTHVLNVLLIGEDTRDEQISDTSRADSAIIASINIDTGKITLTSILRDLYVYFEVDSVGYYDKINAAASLGGMKTYINTVERYYKIAIDNYAVVNFASFPKIIDALGGVGIELSSAEVNEVNNHPKRYAGATLPQPEFDEQGNPKKVMLNGTQALAYCRIRKIDSDNARADRQKTVLNELFKEMKKAGKIDSVKVVNSLVNYVKTGYQKKELVAIGNTALKDGWLNYKVQTYTVPDTGNCAGGSKFSVAYGNWIWLADIPKDAYELQMKIYGKSNINLNEYRPDYISIGR